MNWHKRYKDVKRGLSLSNRAVGEVLGFSEVWVRNATSEKREMPVEFKLFVLISEKKIKIKEFEGFLDGFGEGVLFDSLKKEMDREVKHIEELEEVIGVEKEDLD